MIVLLFMPSPCQCRNAGIQGFLKRGKDRGFRPNFIVHFLPFWNREIHTAKVDFSDLAKIVNCREYHLSIEDQMLFS